MLEEEKVYFGVVVWFNSRAGIGFLAPDDGSKDMFVHYSNIMAEGFRNLKQGERVQYKVGANHKGPQAVEIQVIK